MSPRQILHAFVFLKRYRSSTRPLELQVLIERLKEDDVVFDVGAHAGTWSVPLAQRVKRGQIYAFEALPYYAGILGLTFKLHGVGNAHVLNRAVSDERKTLELVWKDTTGKRLTGKTHLAGKGDESPHRVHVESILLDDFVRDKGITKLGLLKIDIEGAELMAIRGAMETIRKFRPMLFCEVRTEWCARYGYTPADLLKLLEDEGYQANIIQEDKTLKKTDSATYGGKDDVLFLPM